MDLCVMKGLSLIVLLTLYLNIAKVSLAQQNEELAIACVDTKTTNDCEFMRDNDWCVDDMKKLKRKCDKTCGWCSKSDKCIDAADYIQCHKITQEECDKQPEFYSTRCKKSCSWCQGLPDGAWKEWTHWTRCSTTCDPGFQIRSRHCLSRNCEGQSSNVKVCLIAECPKWSTWGKWSDCTVSCGKGVKTRNRNCSAEGQCGEQDKEVTLCEEPPCSVGRVYFNKWTNCTKSCGGGTRTKIPFCPMKDPTSCPKQYEDCNYHRCPYKSCQKYRYGSRKSQCCDDKDATQCVRTAKRVLGGTISKPKQFSWMARIEIVGGMRGPHARELLCGGTLIHQEFVLTAAHCLESVTPDRLRITLGAISKDDTSSLVQRKLVASFEIHPNYSEPENDIAIIRLKSKAAETSFVSTLCMPDGEEAPVDTHCFVAGWGLTNPDLTIGSPNLREAKVRHLPFGVCVVGHRATSYGPHLNETEMICAGKVAGGVDTCRGDSGGPLMCQRCSSCSWYLAGVTSFGSETCGAAKAPGVYMRMSHYEEWVVQYVEQFYKFGLYCDGR